MKYYSIPCKLSFMFEIVSLLPVNDAPYLFNFRYTVCRKFWGYLSAFILILFPLPHCNILSSCSSKVEGKIKTKHFILEYAFTGI